MAPPIGFHHSAETIEKIRRNTPRYWLGRKQSPEHTAKMRASKMGRKHTEEEKDVLRKQMIGRVSPFKGHRHTKESKMLIKNKGIFAKETRNAFDPESNFYHTRSVLRSDGVEGTHTWAEWQILKNAYGNMCACCKNTEPDVEITEDHIIPISLGGTDYINNIQPLCRGCNSRKKRKVIKYD